MQYRQKIKKYGKVSLKKHYLIFVLVCLVAAFLGSEYRSTLLATKIKLVPKTEGIDAKLQLNTVIFKTNINRLPGSFSVKRNFIHGKSNKGVLETVVDKIKTGSVYLIFFDTIISISTTNVSLIIFVIAIFMLFALFWYFIINVYIVISRRIFLEGIIYEKISNQKFLFLSKTKKWLKVSFTMFLKKLMQILWSLTIIGYFIKRYSYYLVPYIVAENPNIDSLKAITLSKNMMKNHKWECFVLDLSFIGWDILGILTFGLSKIFFSNPYKTATMCYYYRDLRAIAKQNKIKYSEYLNDEFLFKKADQKLLEETYQDITKLAKQNKDLTSDQPKIKYHIFNFLGISTLDKKYEEDYRNSQINKLKISSYKAIINGKMYPNRLLPLEYKKKINIKVINNNYYLRHYSITSLILLFFIFSFIGWLWEVSIHFITDGGFVNRGVLHGPYLPIYGAGGVLILLFLNKLRQKPLFEFLATIILCGIVEYFTSFYLETVHHERWWNYDGYFLNLNGRICIEGLLIFGIGGFAVVYIVAPILDNLITKIKKKYLVVLCIALISIFVSDQIYSSKHPNIGDGITNYNSSHNHFKEKT